MSKNKRKNKGSKRKLSGNELNLAILKRQGRQINLDAKIVAPSSIRKSKKIYSRKGKNKIIY